MGDLQLAFPQHFCTSSLACGSSIIFDIAASSDHTRTSTRSTANLSLSPPVPEPVQPQSNPHSSSPSQSLRLSCAELERATARRS